MLLVSTLISVWAAISEHRAEQLAQSRLEAESAARKQAVTQSTKATTMNALLQQMLQAADPDANRGTDYTVRQLLDTFSRDLKEQLKNDPEAEAAIRATIGNAYRRLDLTDEAKPHLEFALETRLRLLGPDNAEVAQSHVDYAWNLFESGNPEGAEADARAALAIYRKLDRPTIDIISILADLQLFLEFQRKYSEAEEIGQQVLSMAGGHPEQFPQVANVLHRLADCARSQGDDPKAERLARQSVALHRKVHGDSHVETAWGLYELGRALQNQLKLDESEACYRDAISILRKQYKDSHKNVQTVMSALVEVLIAKSDEAGVEAIQNEIADRIRVAAGGIDGDDPHFRIYAAKTARSARDLPKAIAECSAALAADPGLAEGWSIRGLCYLEMDEFAKAISDLTAATRLNPGDWWLWHELAYASEQTGERQKAMIALTRCSEARGGESASEAVLGAGKSDAQVSDADFLEAMEFAPANWESRKISATEKAAFKWAAQTSRPLTNGDFKAGLQGWTAEGFGAFGLYSTPTGPAFTTYGAHQDADTGRLYQCFKVPDDAISMRFAIQGGSDERRRYVALWRQDRVFKHVTARNENTFIDVHWDLTPLRGEIVTLEIVDHSRGPFGFITARDFVIVRP